LGGLWLRRFLVLLRESSLSLCLSSSSSFSFFALASSSMILVKRPRTGKYKFQAFAS
jgi:hypothetical protein